MRMTSCGLPGLAMCS